MFTLTKEAAIEKNLSGTGLARVNERWGIFWTPSPGQDVGLDDLNGLIDARLIRLCINYKL